MANENDVFLVRVRAAFTDAPRPDARSISRNEAPREGYEFYPDEGTDTARLYAGKNWAEVNESLIAQAPDAPIFMENIAFRYYVAGFMTTAARSADPDETWAWSVACRLCPTGVQMKRFPAKFYDLAERFSLQQAETILAFLEFMRRFDESGVYRRDLDAGEAFWTRRIEELSG